MNTKRVLVVAFAICLLLSAAIAACGVVLTRHFDAVEHEQADGMLRRGQQTLDAHLKQLVQRTLDHAQSVSSATALPRFEPGSTAALDTLRQSGLDALTILGAEGRELQPLLLTGAQPGSATLAATLRSQLLQQWSDQQRGRPGIQLGWLNTERGLLALCALDLSGDRRVLLFAGRYFDDPTARSTLQVVALDDPARPVDLSPVIAAWLHQASPATLLVLDDPRTHRSVGHAVLRDMSGRPIALLRAATSGDISLAGRRTTWLAMGSLALLLGACSFALILLILRLQHGASTGSAVSSNFMHGLRESMAVVDPADGRLLDANDALLRALDYERNDLELLTLRSVYLDLPGDLGTDIANPTAAPVECRMRARDGRLIDAEVTFAPLNYAGRELLCIVGRDISQRKQAEQSLAESTSLFEHLCTHDAMTGLPNRTFLQTHLPTLLQDAADDAHLLAILYLDLDAFKEHNQSQGDGRGDALLKQVAARLRSELPADHVLAHMGGDEFVVVAPSLTSQAAIDALADELLELIRHPLSLADTGVSLTTSIGVAVYPQHGLDGDTLLKHADIALYQAKQAGRNRYRLFVDDMNVQQSEHVILEQSLRRAIDTDQIQLEYQPVVDLHTGLVTSFEALARWRHPQLGSVPPQRFIPVAERSKLILPLGEQIVRLVILQLHDWQAAGLSLVPVAINVTALQLELTDFAGHVRELAQRYAVDLKWLAFEVTAAVWTQGHDKQLATLEQLRAAGAHIYMDECSTACLDVEELRTLPIDGLKFDPRLIRRADEAPDALKTVTDTIARARKLQLMTVAEGVETTEQVDQLRQLGCQCGQGYYFSKPIAPLQCRSLLQQMGETRRLTDTVKARAFRIKRARETAG